MFTEREIVDRVRQGEIKAFEQLYADYEVYLCTVATRYIFNAQAAQEIVNDIFLNIWKNRVALVYPVRGYLIRSVQNRCLNYFRQQRLEECSLSEVDEYMFEIQEQQMASDVYPLAYLENKELQEKIAQAIDKLPHKCREIFMAYLYRNLSYEEIAQVYGISTSTVRVQIKIALTKLCRILSTSYFSIFFVFYFFLENVYNCF